MNAPYRPPHATARAGNAGASGVRVALDCARNVYEVVDRRMPEAAALANWLGQSATAFGLPDTVIPDYEALAGQDVAASPDQIGVKSVQR